MPEKLKILLVVRWPVGGIRTFMKYVYRRFPSSQYCFTVVTPDLPEVDTLADDLRGCDFTFVRMRNPSFWSIARETMSCLRGGNFDIVHSHGFTSGVCALVPAFLYGKPHILTSHDVLNRGQFSGLRGMVRKLALTLLLRTARYVHSVGHDAQENLHACFGFLEKSGKSVVIRNGIDTATVLGAPPADLRKELGVDRHVMLLGFFGRFMAQKGFRCLVDAVERVRGGLQVPLRVACFGSGGFVREERLELEKRGLAEHFLFLPFVPDVAGTIKGLDAVVVPSLWEACPLLPMEVLVAGVPLIASECVGLREVVKETPALTFTPGSSPELAERIEQLAERDYLPAFRSFAGTAATLFDVGDQAASIRSLYARAHR